MSPSHSQSIQGSLYEKLCTCNWPVSITVMLLRQSHHSATCENQQTCKIKLLGSCISMLDGHELANSLYLLRSPALRSYLRLY